ncbi:MAG TPA: thiamine phosphate synthase [Rhabdochlamydiaceae bacterium]|jgi:thiamine-phosphate diphosphorylase
MAAVCRYLSSICNPYLHAERLPARLSLYLVANRPSFKEESAFFWKVRRAVEGGVTCVQLRDHESDFSTALKTADQMRNILKDTPLFINLRDPSKSIKAAQEVGAEGVYLEEPFSPAEARKNLGHKAIIGIPVKTLNAIFEANQCRCVDYVSVKVFASKRTCPKNDNLWEMEGFYKALNNARHPIVAIGGLESYHARSFYKELRKGDGMAMAGGLMGQEDPYFTACEIAAIQQQVSL